MPKYKYVDGVKYRVVPQSVLGYALVREGSDNSLPTGGTDGQVLAKASNADYDVEWATVEGGGDCLHFIIDAVQGESPGITVIADETKAGEYFNNVKNGKLPILCITAVVGSDILKAYATELSTITPHAGEGEESFDISLAMTTVTRDRVLQKKVNISLGKVLATEQYHCEMTVTNVVYPPAG